MPKPFSNLRLAFLFAAGAVAAACAFGAPASSWRASNPSPAAAAISLQPAADLAALRGPVVIGLSGTTSTLQYWQFGPGRHPAPTKIGGIGGLGYGGIAATGRQIAIANGNEIVLFDLQTKNKIVLGDPYGNPLDVAIGKSGAIYAANLEKNGGKIVVYAPGTKPREVNCPLLEVPNYVAVDNEGDVFVAQNGRFTGIVEIPTGPGGLDGAHCTALKLQPGVSGYAACSTTPLSVPAASRAGSPFTTSRI